MDMAQTAHLAELSKIYFTRRELAEMARDMEEIMALMDQIKAVDQTLPPYRQQPAEYSGLRRDLPEETPGVEREFIVPKMLG